jgi:hypothetical protein
MRAFEPEFELLWQGGFHFGDAPGAFDEAQFVGLTCEWPFTLRKLDPADRGNGQVTLRLDADNVNILGGSLGHTLTVIQFSPNPHAIDRWWRGAVRIIGSDRLSSNSQELELALPPNLATAYFALRLEVDTSLAPGLLNDFVVRQVMLKSSTHGASFGFQFASPRMDERTPLSAA